MNLWCSQAQVGEKIPGHGSQKFLSHSVGTLWDVGVCLYVIIAG